MTLKEYNNIRHRIISNDIPHLGLDNRLISKIDMLYEVENILEIKRYAINDINEKHRINILQNY